MDSISPPETPRPRIAHVMHYDGAGGGPVVLAEHLRTFVAEAELGFFHGGSGLGAQTCEELGIPHWRLPLDRLWKLPGGILLLAVRLRQFHPDLIILHGQWAGPAGAIAAWLAGIRRLIYLVHWPSFYTDWDLVRTVRNRIAEVIPCRLAERIVILSRGNAYQYLIRQIVPPEKLRLIHNSMDPRRVPSPERIAEVRARHGWDAGHLHVISVGRLADQKRLDWLLRSWQLVAPRAPHARLWIVGEGPERAALERLARDLGVNSSCQFLGPQPSGIDYVGAADLVAMTTIYEGFGLVPVEAMACGKALVANAVDGVNDTVRDGVEGYLAQPGDIATFAERLCQLIDDGELRRHMGAAGRARATEFSPVKIMGQYRELFREVLKTWPPT